MIINAWVEIRDTFTWPAEDPADDTQQQAINRRTLEQCADITIVPNIYKTRTQGPRSWQLYSLIYDVPTRQQFEQAIELFKSENPGDTDVLGAWHFETGEELKDDNVPLYPMPGYLNSYMPDDLDENGSPVPNNTLRDVNLLQGQTSRSFV